jgi:hypothetical protein
MKPEPECMGAWEDLILFNVECITASAALLLHTIYRFKQMAAS